MTIRIGLSLSWILKKSKQLSNKANDVQYAKFYKDAKSAGKKPTIHRCAKENFMIVSVWYRLLKLIS